MFDSPRVEVVCYIPQSCSHQQLPHPPIERHQSLTLCWGAERGSGEEETWSSWRFCLHMLLSSVAHMYTRACANDSVIGCVWQPFLEAWWLFYAVFVDQADFLYCNLSIVPGAVRDKDRDVWKVYDFKKEKKKSE